MHIQVEKDDQFIDSFLKQLEDESSLSTWDLFKLTIQSELTTITPSFHGLQSLKVLPHMNFLPHQIQTAKQAIEQMNGRAILADEVGLGKTIEAGLILKEYMVRGLVKKVIILVPSSLVNQWVQELNEKFLIPAVSFRKNYAWEEVDVIVTSIDTAKRSPHRESILNISYDLLIVDEAHKLKNHKTQNYQFVRNIQKKYCLLLTATPIQNRLIEIFNLVSILKPGLLGDYGSFLKTYGHQKKMVTDNKYLKQLIQKVMIRNIRSKTDLQSVKRNIHTVWLQFNKQEMSFYETLNNFSDTLQTFSKITLLREICSSREACYVSLKKFQRNSDKHDYDELIKKIEQLPHHPKANKVVELIQSLGDEKVIIFTEYRATQYYLQLYLQQHGITAVPFSGGFKASKKDWMKQLFENHAQVLIATEAGGEGINLQFCRHLINYDLPWNPMRLEQRIGRIHRFGQKNDVHIYNFALRQTIEEHVLTLLYEKIHLFENVIGELDDILARLNIDNIESEIEHIYDSSNSQGEAHIKLNHLTSVIQSEIEQQQFGEGSHENY